MEDLKKYKTFVLRQLSNPNTYKEFENLEENNQASKLKILNQANLVLKKGVSDAEIRFMKLKNRLKVNGHPVEKILKEKKMNKEDPKTAQYKKLLSEIAVKKKKLIEKREKLNELKNAKTTRKNVGIQYELDDDIAKDLECQNSLKLLQNLQKQYMDSKDELGLLEKAVKSRKLPENELNEHTYLLDIQAAEKEQQNDTIRVISNDINKENEELSKHLEYLNKKVQDSRELNLNLLERIRALPKDKQHIIEEEIDTIEKKIKILETTVKEISQNAIFDNDKRERFLNQFDSIEAAISEQKTKYVGLQKFVNILEDNIEKIKKEVRDKEKEREEVEYRYTEIAVRVKNKIPDITYAHEKKNHFYILGKPKQKKLEEPVQEQKTKRIYLESLYDDFKDEDLALFGLERDTREKGWYFINEKQNLQRINKLEQKEKEIEEKKLLKLNLVKEIQVYRINQETDYLIDDTCEARQRNLNSINEEIESIKREVEDKKEIIRMKFKNEKSLANLKCPNKTSFTAMSKSTITIDSRDENQSSLFDSLDRNRFEVYLGEFQIFRNALKALNVKNLKFCVGLNFFNLEPALSNMMSDIFGNFNQVVAFEFTLDMDFLKYCSNSCCLIELFNVDNEDNLVKLYSIKVDMNEMLGESIRDDNFCLKNRYEIESEKTDSHGYIDVSCRFKYSTKAAYAFLNNNFDNLNHLLMRDTNAVDEEEIVEKPFEDIQKQLKKQKSDDLPKLEQMFGIEEELSLSKTSNTNPLSTDRESKLGISVNRLTLPDQHRDKQYFVYYEFFEDFNTETANKDNNFDFRYSFLHKLNNEGYKEKTITFYLFEERTEEIMRGQVDEGDDLIGVADLELSNYLQNDHSVIKTLDMVHIETGKQMGFSIDIQLLFKEGLHK